MKTDMIPVDTSAPKLVTIEMPSDALDDGARVNYFHRLSSECGRISIASALIAAFILYKKRMLLPGAFNDWVDANTTITRRTASRYLLILEKSFTREEILQIIDNTQLQLEAVEAFTAQTNYQSLYQLYHAEGIVKKSNIGGNREGAGRPKKLTADEMEAQAKAIACDPELIWNELKGVMDQMDAFVMVRDGLGLLNNKQIDAFRLAVRSWMMRATELCDRGVRRHE